MVRKLLGVCSAMMAIGFAGCNLLPTENDDSVDIKLAVPSSIEAGSNAAKVTGSIKGNVEISSVSYSITDADGNEITSKIITHHNTAPTTEKELDLEKDLAVTIEATSSACNGTYTFSITASAGSASSTKTGTFTVKGGSDDCGDNPNPELTETQVTLGSWKSSIGSSLDADEMKVYKASEITSSTIEAKMDAYFSNNSDGQAWLWSPKAAAGATYAPKDWDVQNDTKFLEVSSANYNNVHTQSDIDALWSDTGAKNYADLSAGDVIIIKTNEGAKRMIKVISAETTDNGTAVIVGLK